MIHVIISRISKYTGYMKLTLAISLLYNLQWQLLQCHVFIFAFNVDRERDV